VARVGLAAALLCAALFPSSAAALGVSGGSVGVRQPHNIILVVLDDWGRDLSNQYTGSVTTPTIDSLASQGRVATDFLVQPLCATTRATILSGRYAFRHGVAGPTPDPGYSANEISLPAVLREAGYATAGFGKLGLSMGWPVLSPHDTGVQYDEFYYSSGYYGFDHFAGNYNASGSYGPHEFFTVTPLGGGWQYSPATPDDPGSFSSDYPTTENGDDAVAWIVAHLAANPRQPFFLYLGFNALHTTTHHLTFPVGNVGVPVDGPPADGVPDTCPGGETAACVAEMLRAADTQIGLVLDELTPAQLENTLVVVIGDNGSEGGGKGTVLESGIKVPAIFAHGRIPAASRGTTLSGLYSAADLFTTFIDLARIGRTPPNHPNDPGSLLDAGPAYIGQARIVDGVSLRGALLEDGSSVLQHDYVWARTASGTTTAMRGSTPATTGYKFFRDGSGDHVYVLPDESATDVCLTTGAAACAELSAALDALEASEP